MAATQFNPETPPELVTAQWFNAPEPLSLKKLKGKAQMGKKSSFGSTWPP